MRTRLAAAKLGHGVGVSRVADQMKAAESAHGGNPALPERGQQKKHGGVAHDDVLRQAVALLSLGVQGLVRVIERRAPGKKRAFRLAQPRRIAVQPEHGAAVRAGVGLGVETPVGRIVVFFGARRAHGKTGHAGHRPVVGNGSRNGVARPAVRAVGEGIAETPVARIGHVGKARVAGSDVRAHQHAVTAVLAVEAFVNAKFALVLHDSGLTPLQRGDAGKRGTRSGKEAKFSSAASSPCTSMRTPSDVLPTLPVSPSCDNTRSSVGSEPHALNLTRDRVDVPCPHAILRRAV